MVVNVGLIGKGRWGSKLKSKLIKKSNLKFICGKEKNYSNTVTSNKNLGGGVLLELSHEIDYLLWIFKKIKIVLLILG